MPRFLGIATRLNNPISTQCIDRLSEFLVDHLRFFPWRLIRGLQRIVNNLKYTFTAVEQNFG